MKNLVLSGHLAYDRLVKCNLSFKDVARDQSPESFAISGESQKEVFGGCVGNIAYGLAIQNVRFHLLSALGELDSTSYLKHLRELEISTSGIEILPDSLSNTCYIFSDWEHLQKTIFVLHYAYNSKTFHYVYPDPSVIGFFFISADAPYLLNESAKYCQENKIPFALDAGQQLTNFGYNSDLFLDTVKGADLFFLNQSELEYIHKTLRVDLETLLANVGVCIMTSGSNPVVVRSRMENLNFYVEVPETHGVVDTTGAGDAFRAGFMAEYLKEKTIQECVINGNFMATRSLRSSEPQGYEI